MYGLWHFFVTANHYQGSLGPQKLKGAYLACNIYFFPETSLREPVIIQPEIKTLQN